MEVSPKPLSFHLWNSAHPCLLQPCWDRTSCVSLFFCPELLTLSIVQRSPQSSFKGQKWKGIRGLLIFIPS